MAMKIIADIGTMHVGQSAIIADRAPSELGMLPNIKRN